MLTGVDVDITATERTGESAKPRPRFEDGHHATGVGQLQRSRDSRKTTADDNDARRLAAHVRPCG
jgi:hypothetical protein